MINENFHSQIAIQNTHVLLIHLPVTVQIKTEAAHGMDRHIVVRRPARIIDVSTLTGNNFISNFVDIVHRGTPMLCGIQGASN